MAFINEVGRFTPEGADYNEWLRLERELDEALKKRRVKRVAEVLVREPLRVGAEASADPIDQLFAGKVAASQERVGQLEQELETRLDLESYFVGQLDYQISEAAQSLSELHSWGMGYNTGIDVKRNFLERQLAQFRRERRDAELATWEDIVQLRKELREATEEYQSVARRYEMIRRGGKDGS
jgi:hypothetical protein